MLLEHRSIPIVIGIFLRGIGTRSIGETGIAPGGSGASWGKCGEIGIDPDRHDGRFAAPVHHLGIGKYGGACDPSQPDERIGLRLGRFLGGGIRREIVCRIRAVGLERGFRPEELAGPAGADVIKQLNFECVPWGLRNCLAKRIVSHGFTPSALINPTFSCDVWRIMLYAKSSTNRSRFSKHSSADDISYCSYS